MKNLLFVIIFFNTSILFSTSVFEKNGDIIQIQKKNLNDISYSDRIFDNYTTLYLEKDFQLLKSPISIAGTGRFKDNYPIGIYGTVNYINSFRDHVIFFSNSKQLHESIMYSYTHNSAIVSYFQNEFIGWKTDLTLTQYWKLIQEHFQKNPKERLILSANQTLNTDFNSKKDFCNDSFIYIDLNVVKEISTIQKKKLIFDTHFFNSKKIKKWDDKNLYKLKIILNESSQIINSTIDINGNIPIMLIDEKNHKNRADSEDWRIYVYMNKSNGDFFQYFFFETELDQEWPLYIRDFALDHLAGAHICKKSTVLVNKKSHEKVFKQGHMRGNNPKDVYIHKTKGKQWRPAPVPKDKNTIPKDRLFFDKEPGRIFGSYAKVWELDVWQMLPNMLRDNPEGVYLIGYGTLLHLNECKTHYEEQALLKKCGVLITPQIYKELQSLRRLDQSQSPSPKK